MKTIILIAPPAAGKGTQANLISERYQIPHISTGDLLRNISLDTPLGKRIHDIQSQGLLVSDEIVLELLKLRITDTDCNDGYVLDGFPRSLSQAAEYLNILGELNKEIGIVIALDIPYEIAKKRIIGRISCSHCGTVYNNQFEDSKPQNDMNCDICHNELTKRDDDNTDVFEKRYQVYKSEIEPIIEYFKDKTDVYYVDSSINKDYTFNEIVKIIEAVND